LPVRQAAACIVAGTNSGGVFRSIDNGTTWAASNSGLTDTSRILSVSADDDTVFASVYPGGVFRSDNNGINWTVVTQGFSPAVVLVSNGYVIAATGGGFGGCSNSEGLSATQIYHSSDNGVSWQGVLVQPSRCVFTASSSCWYQCYFSGFLSLAANDTTVFAGKETYNIAFSPPMTVPGGVVFRSLNNGISWNAVVNFGITTSVRSLYVKNGYIYAGVEPRGVHCSADNGSSWTVMNSGLTDTSIYSLAANTDYLFAGTRSHGVWRWLLSKTPTSIKQQQAHIAGREILKLIPRNRSLTVSFSLPRRENVKLNVFDLSGHLVATLCDKTMQAGQHAVSWDTRSLASGCYIVRLQADATTQVKSVPLFR
jgi:hypothetical protein